MTRSPRLFRRCVLLALITTASACGPGACSWSKSSSAPASTSTPASTPASSGSGLAGVGAPLDLHITYTGTSPNCTGTMQLSETKASVSHGKNITWLLNGSGCTGFDEKLACVSFSDDAVGTNRTPCGAGNPGNAKIIATVTTNTNPPYQDGSMHTYDITYNNVPTGDPEIDINDGGGGVPGTGTPPAH